MIEPRFYKLETVESTNDAALDMARHGEPEGAVITALSQTKGRGRRGRTWYNQAGQNIIMSVILTPDIPFNRVPELTFVASLSVLDCLAAIPCNGVSLKWPNDVLINGKKASGILLETCTSAERNAVIIGIGVNLNQSAFSSDIADIATSVYLEIGTKHDIETVTQSLALSIFSNYQAYLSEGFEEILTRWRKYMWGLGKHADIQAEGRSISGRISGISSDGALLLAGNDGTTHTIYAADSIRILQT